MAVASHGNTICCSASDRCPIHHGVAPHHGIHVGEIMGRPSGPLYPLTKYQHRIDHRTGQQDKYLIPPFRISGNSAASLELEIFSADPGIGLGWLMRLGFVTESGTIYTEIFQLFLPKSKTGAEVPTEQRELKSMDNDTKVGLLERKVVLFRNEVGYIECIFNMANITDQLSKLDRLDKYLLFYRANWYSINEFMDEQTETDPSIKYEKLLGKEGIIILLTLIKTHVACSEENWTF
jgi:hypothetical protein